MSVYVEKNGKEYAITYHLVFCPRYRRKIFLITGVSERCKEIAESVCRKYSMTLERISFGIDYCYLVVSAPPEISPAMAVTKIKIATGRSFLNEFEEFSKTQNIWTRNYLVSTNEISVERIESFVKKQVSHY